MAAGPPLPLYHFEGDAPRGHQFRYRPRHATLPFRRLRLQPFAPGHDWPRHVTSFRFHALPLPAGDCFAARYRQAGIRRLPPPPPACRGIVMPPLRRRRQSFHYATGDTPPSSMLLHYRFYYYHMPTNTITAWLSATFPRRQALASYAIALEDKRPQFSRYYASATATSRWISAAFHMPSCRADYAAFGIRRRRQEVPSLCRRLCWRYWGSYIACRRRRRHFHRYASHALIQLSPPHTPLRATGYFRDMPTPQPPCQPMI